MSYKKMKIDSLIRIFHIFLNIIMTMNRYFVKIIRLLFFDKDLN